MTDRKAKAGEGKRKQGFPRIGSYIVLLVFSIFQQRQPFWPSSSESNECHDFLKVLSHQCCKTLFLCQTVRLSDTVQNGQTLNLSNNHHTHFVMFLVSLCKQRPQMHICSIFPRPLKSSNISWFNSCIYPYQYLLGQVFDNDSLKFVFPDCASVFPVRLLNF